MRGLDRPSPTPGSLPAAAPRGAFAAVAAVAALLLSLAVLATTPRAGLQALGGARIAFLTDTPGASAAQVDHPSVVGVREPAAAVATACPRAALAARAAVLLRHTSLPPPALA